MTTQPQRAAALIKLANNQPLTSADVAALRDIANRAWSKWQPVIAKQQEARA